MTAATSVIPNRITRWLYLAAVVAPLIGLVVAILAVTSDTMESASSANKAVAFLTPLLEGLFAGGVIAGFVGYTARRGAGTQTRRLTISGILQIGAMAAFIIGVLIAGLVTKEMGDYASGNGKALNFLAIFARSAVLYGGILAGFAALNTPSPESRVGNGLNPAAVLMFVTAYFAFAIGLAMASLTTTEMSSDASGSDTTATFFRVFLQVGLLYSGILTGFGLMLTARRG